MAPIAQILVCIDGVFDLKAARLVAEALAAIGPSGALQVDLTRVRDFHDAGLAALARSLGAAGSAVRVVVSGLRQHQLRILRYLGVDLAALAARAGPLSA